MRYRLSASKINGRFIRGENDNKVDRELKREYDPTVLFARRLARIRESNRNYCLINLGRVYKKRREEVPIASLSPFYLLSVLFVFFFFLLTTRSHAIHGSGSDDGADGLRATAERDVHQRPSTITGDRYQTMIERAISRSSYRAHRLRLFFL